MPHTADLSEYDIGRITIQLIEELISEETNWVCLHKYMFLLESQLHCSGLS